tara:strand:- start:233 stop:712 length:480 start_codon:yes stop_codon:yes gene_type:complete
MKKIIIGIDPGRSGAISVRYNEELIINTKCPQTVEEMGQVVNGIFLNGESKIAVAYIEQVHAFPTDARSSAFKFGQNYGEWLGILSALEIRTVLVSPQRWMKYFGEQTKEGRLPKDKKDRKNKLKEIAKEYLPINCGNVTLYNADSILINVYGKEHEGK